MTKMRRLGAGGGAVLAALVLGACSSATPTADVRVPANICARGAPASLVGRNIGEVRFAPNLDRVMVSPGQTAPSDIRQGRLVVHVDEKGWIARASCG